MENLEYNRLIYSNKLDELANIWNIIDLTNYQYLHKYLLEYLLEKDIHNTRMDNYASSNSIWISLYLKYNIIEPLVKSNFKELLKIDNNELLLDKLLKVLNVNQKIELYRNIKKQDYWFFIANESLLNDKYKKYGIELPTIYVQRPLILDSKIKVNKNTEELLNDFTKVFSDHDQYVLKTCLNEFKSDALVNPSYVINSILQLINYKKRYPRFKIILTERSFDYKTLFGEYDETKDLLTINHYSKGTFTHEVSHVLFNKFEDKYDIHELYLYEEIKKKINNPNIIKKIVEYLKEFHNNYEYMKNIFYELYNHRVNIELGGFTKYYRSILSDIMDSDIEFITIDENKDNIIYLSNNITDDELVNNALKIDENIGKNYADILAINYYMEEFYLENLLDALLNGRIWEGKYKIRCFSGHDRKYFKDSPTASFDECLADYTVIKNSKRANKIINDLNELVGNDLSNLLDDYINKYRTKNSNIKIKK